jgi:hypothetical protein
MNERGVRPADHLPAHGTFAHVGPHPGTPHPVPTRNSGFTPVTTGCGAANTRLLQV